MHHREIVLFIAFFFLLKPPPPRSPLFPYTTLFRSYHIEADLHATSDHLIEVIESTCLTQLDRKSTRLNSSHVAISYAVFCLKKKKTYAEEAGVTEVRTCLSETKFELWRDI